MNVIEQIAKEVSDHSDYLAVVRWGKKKAKHATRRRNRRLGKRLATEATPPSEHPS